jgi:hypothetical protein
MVRNTTLLVLCALCACGYIGRPDHGNGNTPYDDAAVYDAPPDMAVDAPDAAEQPPPTPSRELVGGAARMSSTTYTLDVEIGHAFSQQPAKSATYTIQGNAAIKP